RSRCLVPAGQCQDWLRNQLYSLFLQAHTDAHARGDSCRYCGGRERDRRAPGRDHREGNLSMPTQRYSVTPHPIETLLTWVKSGEIAIPEIQRPFVWEATKV